MWQLKHKLSNFGTRTLHLMFQDDSADERAQPKVTSNAERAKDRAALVAEFRTGHEWQSVEKLKSRAMSLEGHLKKLKTDVADAERQYTAAITGDLPDASSDEAFATLQDLKKDFTRYLDELASLRVAIVTAWDDAKAAWELLYREHVNESVAADKAKFEAALKKLDAEVGPLLDAMIEARMIWHSNMSGTAIDLTASALGQRPDTRENAETFSAAVEIMNPMRPEPKPVGSAILGEPVYG